MGTYTTASDVENVLALTFSASSVPTLTTVNTLITDVENEISAMGLGQIYTQNELIDVESDPVVGETLAKYAQGNYRGQYDEGLIIVPSKFPIITVSNLWVNKASLGSAPDWEARTEGPASGATFITLKKTVMNKTLSYAIYFFSDMPSKGKAKVKANLLWGWNIDSSILKRYATLKVAERVLLHRMGTNNPDQLAMYTGNELQSYVPTAYDQRLQYIRSEIKKMEQDFPSWVEIAILRN